MARILNCRASVLCAALVLAGCSTPAEYYRAAVEQERLRTAAVQSMADSMRLIAETGSETAKVAAIMGLAFARQSGAQTAAVQPIQSEAVQLIGALAPVLGTAITGYYGLRLGMEQSANATRLGISTNETYAGLAAEIGDPAIVPAPDPVVVVQPAPALVTQPPPVIVRPEVVQPVIVQPGG